MYSSHCCFHSDPGKSCNEEVVSEIGLPTIDSGEHWIPLPSGKRIREEAIPPPQEFFLLELVCFGALWVIFSAFSRECNGQ